MLAILCYHKVGPVSEEGRWLNIEPEVLDSHIRMFLRRGWPFQRVMDLTQLWPNKGVVLTFDDAYESALTHGFEVLQRHSVPGTFYAVPQFVGGASDWDVDRARPLADWPLLASAVSEGHEIGNHTFGHPDLSKLESDDQLQEWMNARRAFGERGIETFSACYPFGRMNDMSQGAVRDAGYEVSVALAKRPARPDDPKLALPRIVIAYSDRVPKLLYKLFVRPRLP